MNLPVVITTPALLPVSHGLMTAMAPFRLAVPIAAAFDKVDGDDLRDLVHTNRAGDLWTTGDADGDATRLWQYADRSAFYLENLPVLSGVEAARDALRADIESEPPIETRLALICTMLDNPVRHRDEGVH